MSDETNLVFPGTTGQELADGILVALAEHDMPGLLQWVFIQTGFLPTEKNWPLMSRTDRRAVKAAMRQYEKKKPDLTEYVEAARKRLATIAKEH